MKSLDQLRVMVRAELDALRDNFTKAQWEIIRHRLEVPDAIIDVLTDGYSEISCAAIERAIKTLEANGNRRSSFNDAEIEVIRECCEGSTYFAGMDDAVARGEITKGYRLASHKAANELERRFSLVIPRG